MNILEAPNIQKYADPTQWVRDKVLPEKHVCGNCHSTLVFDAESDLYLNSFGNIGYTCIVCGDKRQFRKPTAEDRKRAEESEKWAHLSDEEYADLRAKRISERAQLREKYLSYGPKGTMRELAFGSWNTVSHREYYSSLGIPFPTFEEYIEEKYLPEVPPEVRPEPPTKISVYYDDLVEYYTNRQREEEQRKLREKAEEPVDAMELVKGFIPLLVIALSVWIIFSIM